MKIANNKQRGEVAMLTLLLIAGVGATGVYTYKNTKSVRQLSDNQSAMGAQVNRNAEDIDLLGNSYADRYYPSDSAEVNESAKVQRYKSDWRNRVPAPKACGGLDYDR